MKVSKEQAAANRAAIVNAAERLFRERGFSGVAVAEITKAAGLTHGGFYGHFGSKNALAAEACSAAFDKSRSRARRHDDLAAYLSSYLSGKHRDRSESGCPMPAYATEVARQDAMVQASFAAGLEEFLGHVGDLTGLADADARRSRAIAVAAAAVGGMALARATAKAAPDLSAEILAKLERELTNAFVTRPDEVAVTESE